MVSYWAYYELGWGGFWFWDPVENASLMPWLAGTATRALNIVMEKRDALKVWTICSLSWRSRFSLLGTFLVRSGVLTSVHTFASDPGRGVFILAILIFFIGGGFVLYAWRAPVLKQGGLFAPVSREGALVINNLSSPRPARRCSSARSTAGAGAFNGAKISVGRTVLELTFVPLAVILLLILPFGHTLAWKRGDLLGAAQRLLVFDRDRHPPPPPRAPLSGEAPLLAVLGVGLGIFLIAGSVSEIVTRSWGAGVRC